MPLSAIPGTSRSTWAFGSALIANYLALYLIVALWLPGIYVIVLIEEKELRDRFGAAYDDYCRRVPRFIPRFNL